MKSKKANQISENRLTIPNQFIPMKYKTMKVLWSGCKIIQLIQILISIN